MAIHVLMPALSPTMTEGTIANWMKTEGDKVASGDVLVKSRRTKQPWKWKVDEGVLGKILIAAGTEGVAGKHTHRGDPGRRRRTSPTDSFTTAPASRNRLPSHPSLQLTRPSRNTWLDHGDDRPRSPSRCHG